MKNKIQVLNRSGNRSLKNKESYEIILSKEIKEPFLQKDLIERFKAGDTSPDVISYISSNKLYHQIFLSDEEIKKINLFENLKLRDGILLEFNSKKRVLLKIIKDDN